MISIGIVRAEGTKWHSDDLDETIFHGVWSKIIKLKLFSLRFALDKISCIAKREMLKN